MNRFEAVTGSAAWMTVSLLLAAAALEPVASGAQAPGPNRDLAVAHCADGSARPAAGCESIHL
jgi:hypothetical protein